MELLASCLMPVWNGGMILLTFAQTSISLSRTMGVPFTGPQDTSQSQKLLWLPEWADFWTIEEMTQANDEKQVGVLWKLHEKNVFQNY